MGSDLLQIKAMTSNSETLEKLQNIITLCNWSDFTLLAISTCKEKDWKASVKD